MAVGIALDLEHAPLSNADVLTFDEVAAMLRMSKSSVFWSLPYVCMDNPPSGSHPRSAWNSSPKQKPDRLRTIPTIRILSAVWNSTSIRSPGCRLTPP